jgi:hypothetical protein
MRNRNHRTSLKIVTGVLALAAGFMLRGLAPELVRFLRIKRM